MADSVIQVAYLHLEMANYQAHHHQIIKGRLRLGIAGRHLIADLAPQVDFPAYAQVAAVAAFDGAVAVFERA